MFCLVYWFDVSHIAVVAQEVGHLASDTKDALNVVNEIVQGIEAGTADVSSIMNQNAEQLLQQNSMINKTVKGIRDMMNLLKQSLLAVQATDSILGEQAEIISQAVSFNVNITDGIKQENIEFTNISNMVQNNTEQIFAITSQVDAINAMINELNKLLEN